MANHKHRAALLLAALIPATWSKAAGAPTPLGQAISATRRAQSEA